MPTIISNNFKKLLLLIVLILYSNFAAASSIDITSDTGIITLMIKNRPPLITDIHFSTEIAFEDSKLNCISIVNDENPSEVKFIYRWYINDDLVRTNNNYLTGSKENDLVRCEVTPMDNENVYGEAKSVFITIHKKSAISKVTNFVIKNYNMNLSTILGFLF